MCFIILDNKRYSLSQAYLKNHIYMLDLYFEYSAL